MESRYNYIVIEGNIGAGKTTLAEKISGEFNARLILEHFTDNPFLPKFYEDQEKYSFPLELSFLAGRYRQLKEELESPDMFSSFTVADYYFTKSLIFAASTLRGDEYNLFRQIFYIVYSSLPRPDIFVYLHLDTGRLLRNIKNRGRPYERTITEKYLKSIQDSYFSFFRQNPENKYLVIDISRLDFVSREDDYRKIRDAIFMKDYRAGMNKLIL